MNICFDNTECKLCNRMFKNRRALGNHLSRSHKPYDIHLYVLEFFYNGIVPKCNCGCGKEVKWHKTLYKFNTVLTGHNESIFSKGLYKETVETKQKRLNSIRKAYQEKGKSISKKISKSVKEAFECEEKRARFSELSTNRWKDEDFKNKVSASQKKAWQENYKERYDAVFTEAFRQKISNSNRSREKKIKSKSEIKAFEFIRKCFTDAVDDYWVKLENRNKCFDVYIPSYNLLIELDGNYWHGRDRKVNFTKDQIVSMSNDLFKNRVVSLGYNLCRISLEDNRFDSVLTNVEDLYNISYYVDCLNSSQNKDGMYKFKNNKQVMIEKEHLIKLNKKDKQYVEEMYLKSLTRYFQQYVRNYGWFYPEKLDNLDDVIKKLKIRKVEKGKITSNGQIGNAYLKSNFKSFWNVEKGPIKSWDNKKIMEKVIKYRLGLNNSKNYTYKLSDGSNVVVNETFDISPHNIVRGFIVQRRGVSWFKPVVAYEIYKMILDDIETPVVWDPSMGFGARMLGFSAAYEKGIYFGTDPAKQTFDDLNTLKDRIDSSLLFDGLIEIKNVGSEFAVLPSNAGDLVFTSPPYYDTEKYFNESGQCWKDYTTLDTWTKEYLYPTFKNAMAFLKTGGKLCINISEKYAEVIKDAAINVGFTLINEYDLNLKPDHFSRKKSNLEVRKEPIYIFVK